MKLTGKIGYRQSWTGKIIVTVQCKTWQYIENEEACYWKDAEPKDMMQLGISTLKGA